MGVPTVSVIGSCRVHNPMRAMSNEGRVLLNNARLAEFCHAPREALQKIRSANNRLEIPAELSMLIDGAEHDGRPKERANFKSTDVFVIEMSSVRRLVLNGFELQLNFVTDHLVKPYGLEEWLAQLSVKARNAPPGGRVKHAPDAANCGAPPHVIEQAASIEMSMETDAAIADVVRRIIEYLRKPVVFVGHFDVLKEDGRRVKDRVRLNQCLRAAASEYGAGYFEPAALIESAGAGVALRDNNHWAASFEKEAGSHIFENHIIPAMMK